MRNRKLCTAVLACAAAAMMLMNGCGADKDKAAATTAAETTVAETTVAETKAAGTKAEAAETKAEESKAEAAETEAKAAETEAEAKEAEAEGEGADASEETAADGSLIGPGAGLDSPDVEEEDVPDYEEEDDEYSGEPNPTGKVKSVKKNHSGNLVKPEGGVEEKTPD